MGMFYRSCVSNWLFSQHKRIIYFGFNIPIFYAKHNICKICIYALRHDHYRVYKRMQGNDSCRTWVWVGVSCCSSLLFRYQINRQALWLCTRSNKRTWIVRPLFVPIVLSGPVYRDIHRVSIMFWLSKRNCLKF